jgi:hypothetical protein
MIIMRIIHDNRRRRRHHQQHHNAAIISHCHYYEKKRVSGRGSGPLGPSEEAKYSSSTRVRTMVCRSMQQAASCCMKQTPWWCSRREREARGEVESEESVSMRKGIEHRLVTLQGRTNKGAFPDDACACSDASCAVSKNSDNN